MIALIIITVFVLFVFGTIYSMINHAKHMPDDYAMEEYEIKLKHEFKNENT